MEHGRRDVAGAARGEAARNARGEHRGAWVCGALIAFAVRWAVALQPHSGEGRPPMYGDYEAQRHWQELTLHLPARHWYRNTSRNDLQYWGLDYPPLSAYHSLAMAHVADAVEPAWVAETTSRGREDPAHKAFMRATVVVADAYTFAPAALAYHAAVRGGRLASALGAGASLLHPGLLLVDHAHFQYNCVSLGLFVWAMSAFLRDRRERAAALFSAAVNYKQVELYHALPVFLHLLRGGLRRPESLVRVSLVTCAAFLACWWPLLSDGGESAAAALGRLFPLGRGVFEDKVANVWCATDPLFKWRTAFGPATLAKLCTLATALAVLPSCAHLFARPDHGRLVLATLNSSLGFFLLSYQVHEKSVLACVAAALLRLPDDPAACVRFVTVASYSMLPLFVRNGSTLCWCSLTVLYAAAFRAAVLARAPDSSPTATLDSRKVNAAFGGTDLGRRAHAVLDYVWAANLPIMGALAFCLVSVSPPRRYPDLFPVLVSTHSCVLFALFFLYFNLCQMFVPGGRRRTE